MNDKEIEIKFYIQDLKRLEARVLELGATVLEPRTFEANLRFDLPDGSLRAEGRVLRLRRDSEIRMTYKGPAKIQSGVMARTEIEFSVSDFDAAKKFIEALGYRQSAVYEKFRTTYDLGSTHIMFDELPYGNFIEIEGTDVETIRATASRLGLHWESAVATSYLALFERLCAGRDLDSTQLTFAALRQTKISPDRLQVEPADR